MEEVKNKGSHSPNKKISPLRNMLRVTIAVVASVLFIVLIIAGYSFYTLSSNKVFNENFRSYELTTVKRDSSEAGGIEQLYKEKRFKDVINMTGNRPTVEDNFLKAMSYVELNNNSKAIEYFKQVLKADEQTGKPIMKDETEYYLALTYIRNKDFDLALNIMNKIHNDTNHLYQDKVTTRLIRRVRMLKWR
jgi:predicted negative regulator of RcsB-dependent stress response